MHKKPIFLFYSSVCRVLEVTGEIDKKSTTTSRFSTCCAANVYIFAYIFIGTPIVPLTTVKPVLLFG